MGRCILVKGGSGGGTGSADATAFKEHVLAGFKTVTKDSNDEVVEGTMRNNGRISASLKCGQSYNILAGYSYGSILAEDLEFQTPATATQKDLLSGKTAWVNGTKVTGTMSDFSGIPTLIEHIRMSNGRFEVAVTRGYHDCYWAGNSYEYMPYSTVANAIGLTADKLKKGVNILGVTGTFEGYVPTSTDWYLRGNNIVGFQSDRFAFESGFIRFNSSAITNMLRTSRILNLAGYRNLNIEFNNLTMQHTSSADVSIILYRYDQSGRVKVSELHNTNGWYNYTGVLGIPINAGISGTFEIEFNVPSGKRMSGNIYRIWVN